jgi:hypothetical protein
MLSLLGDASKHPEQVGHSVDVGDERVAYGMDHAHRDDSTLRPTQDSARDFERGGRPRLAGDDELAWHHDSRFPLRELCLERLEHLLGHSRCPFDQAFGVRNVGRQLRADYEQLALQAKDQGRQVAELVLGELDARQAERGDCFIDRTVGIRAGIGL